ncbi:MAG: hypothetical protein QOG54_1073 [Actinomycetota bacterium]|jgi:hypothetical protein|nr:hypothetical protein [Actinomycetota bacterium]
MADEEKSEAKHPEPELPKPRPAGEPEAVAKVREVIEAKLVELVGGYAVDPNGSYIVGLESARVFVVPAWLDDDSIVARVFAITNLDVPVSAELTSFLLGKNMDFVLGAFALDVENGAVWLNHNLMANPMSPEELGAVLGAIAHTADQYDDEIKERFGGRLYIEEPGKSVPTPATPGYL